MWISDSRFHVGLPCHVQSQEDRKLKLPGLGSWSRDLPGAGFDPEQQGRQRRRGDAFDAGGLAQGGRTDAGEFLHHLGREPGDIGVVEVGRKGERFVATEGGDVGALAVEIAGVERIGFELVEQFGLRARRARARGGAPSPCPLADG